MTPNQHYESPSGSGNGWSAVFRVGDDYHLGDLLWLTAVLAHYRRVRRPTSVVLALPDRDISRILGHNHVIDRLIYLSRGSPADPCATAGTPGSVVLHDLRPLPLALGMIKQWRRRLPWEYYWDLWMEPRGQWLARYLGLGDLENFRPTITLTPADRRSVPLISRPYVVLAPHIGSYRLPLTRALWRRIKGWDPANWMQLCLSLRRKGLEVVTLGAPRQAAVPGSIPLMGLPIRGSAAIVENAAAVVGGESGLWFVAAALEVPFVIVPWWLPQAVDWAAPMRVPHRLVRRRDATVAMVVSMLQQLVKHDG